MVAIGFVVTRTRTAGSAREIVDPRPNSAVQPAPSAVPPIVGSAEPSPSNVPPMTERDATRPPTRAGATPRIGNERGMKSKAKYTPRRLDAFEPTNPYK
jgi:hypothetical protein